MILHLANQDKFIPPFIDFLDRNFNDFSERHFFLIEKLSPLHQIVSTANIRHSGDFGRWEKIRKLLVMMYRADKIILHGLWNQRVVELLAFQPWLLKKCYWFIWGGDLYSYLSSQRDKEWRRREFYRRIAIRRMGHLVTYIDGDVALARKWYNARGIHHDCLMYTSNVHQDCQPPRTSASVTNILMGNSSDPSNEHFATLGILKRFANEPIHIYAPLSYGDEAHASRVAAEGARLFGSKFSPLLTFIPLKEYLDLLGRIDIVVFNHNRQQAMGNTIALLGLGKKVYMRNDVNQSVLLEKIGAKVFDINNLDLSLIDPVVASANQRCIRGYFSAERLRSGLSAIFDS